VSREDVELVRAAYEAYSRGDMEAAAAAYAPDNEWDLHRFRPDIDATTGVDELAEGIGSWRDAWDDHFFELESLTEAGEDIVAVINEGGVGRTSGVPVRLRYGQIITVRDGKIAKTVVYRDPDEAFTDAGIAPT
jgi:ketosteroid isomerase-like protein